jgi:hypothetical protein
LGPDRPGSGDLRNRRSQLRILTGALQRTPANAGVLSFLGSRWRAEIGLVGNQEELAAFDALGSSQTPGPAGGDLESEDHAVAAQLPAGPVTAAVRHSGRATVEAALRSFLAPRSRADGTVRMGVVFRCYLAERTR